MARALERVLLGDVAVVAARLATLRAAGVVDVEPTPWQLCLGALRLWHRALFRPETVGTAPDGVVRPTWRARLLANRALRLPALLASRAVVPHDFTGLRSPPAALIRHLLGAHHQADQFGFDLELLAGYGELATLAAAVADVQTRDDEQARWLRDLTVFDGYHAQLATAVAEAQAHGVVMSDAEARDPDRTFIGAMRWCAAQPATPRATWQAWRAGTFAFDSGARA